MLFFFCKQKTAYEMRISDWSSDVCSSDLDLFPPLPPLADQCAVRHEHVVEENLVEVVMPRHVDDRADRDAGRIEVDQQLAEPRITLAAFLGADEREHDVREMRAGGPDFLAEIGRASCWESVWQYLWIVVVAVSLKKQQEH